MKKQLLTVSLAALMAMISGCEKRAAVKVSPAVSQDQIRQGIAGQIIGTWVLVEATRPGTPSGIQNRLKSYTGTHWMITQSDPRTGLVVFHHGGRYTLQGDVLTENIDFAAESTKSVIGGSGRIRLTVDGDILKQIDLDRGVYNETWKRYQSIQPPAKPGAY